MRLVEKYRPKSFDEVVGQEDILPSILEIVERGFDDAPHMLFAGPPGTGKTSVAMLIAKAWFGKNWRNHFVELNASDERGIETVREKIKRYAFAVGKRIIFLDEADSMTPDAQNALRRIMEQTRTSIFILSCNWEWKIIDPIKSRCAIFRFKKLDDKAILRKLLEIIRAEGVKVENKEEFKKGILLLVKMSNGDLRRAINYLETIITNGKTINLANVLALREPDIVVDAMKKALDGDFENARKLIEDALIKENFSWEKVVEKLYSAIKTLDLPMEVKARLFVKLSDVEYRIKFGASPVIQLVAFISYVWIVKYLPAKCPLLNR